LEEDGTPYSTSFLDVKRDYNEDSLQNKKSGFCLSTLLIGLKHQPYLFKGTTQHLVPN